MAAPYGVLAADLPKLAAISWRQQILEGCNAAGELAVFPQYHYPMVLVGHVNVTAGVH